MSERPPPDWLGALLATLGLGALTWGLTAWSASDRLDAAAAAALGAGAAPHARLPRGRAAARRRGDGAAGPVRLARLRRPHLVHLPALRRARRADAAPALHPDRGGGYPATTAGAALLPLPDRHRLGLAADGQARRPDRPALAADARARCWSPAGFALALRIGGDDQLLDRRPARRSCWSRPAWRSRSRRSPPPC